ncbi:hypothetical protein TNCV_192421 [Trichonephila clavipes]|nr:hypothetical protein TNCV_192421 [Trichonephila clavipes]
MQHPTAARLPEGAPVTAHQNMGFTAHFSTAVRNHLHVSYSGKWIKRCGSIDWPPRSLDLNPLDLFL